MTTFAARSQALTDALTLVQAGWPKAPWSWDGRFDCALSTVSKAFQDQARAALTQGLPATWTPETLPNAPAAIAQLCASAGGLQRGQLAFSAELPDGAFVYCLWWPWGSGANVSARIGALTGSGEDSLTPVIRAALGIAP